MKFLYQYRTKDNEVRCGEIIAADRDAAYAELRAKGIKASRMEEAPGLLNKVFGKGKRWIAIVVLGVAAAVAMLLWLRLEKEIEEATRVASVMPRHQIYGDPEIVSKFQSFDSLCSALGSEGDALLACFAQPGKVAEVPRGIKAEVLLSSAMDADQVISESDTRELKELKQIVNGIREELVAYVRNPGDAREEKKKLHGFFQRLLMRSSEEKRIYDIAEQDFKKGLDEKTRSARNAKLRKLGLPPIISE